MGMATGDGSFAGPDPDLDPAAAIKPTACWGPWATAGWSLLLLAAWMLTQVGALVALVVVATVNQQKTIDLENPGADGTVVAVATIAGLPVIAGLPWLLARWRAPSARDYLALRPAKGGQIALAVAGLLAFQLGMDGLTYAIGRPVVPEVMGDVFRTAPIGLLLAALLVCAPVGEEILFRGFLYRGLAESRLGPGMAIGLTALAFAAMNAPQYDLYELAQVYLVGLYLGTARHLTGSTRLAILLHVLGNSIAAMEAMLLG